MYKNTLILKEIRVGAGGKGRENEAEEKCIMSFKISALQKTGLVI